MRPILNISFILLTILLCLPIKVSAVQPIGNDYYFKQISVQQGLSQSKVTAIECDQRGNVWIGTHTGLNRYAEGRVTNYFYQSNNPQSLPGNNILFILAATDHTLWIGTEGGLACYNRTTDQFEHLKFKNKPIKVSSACLLPDGILFGGDGELFRFDHSSKEFTHTDLTKKRDLLYRINSIFPINSTHFYLSTTQNGIWTYNFSTKEHISIKQYEGVHLSAFYVSGKGHLWTSPYGKGLYCHTPSGKQLAHFDTKNSALTNNVILDIKENQGIFWLATDGGGVNLINPLNRSIETLMHTPGDGNSLPANSINTLYFDKQNNAWVGSIREGLIGIRRVYTKTFHDTPLGNTTGLSTRAVLCIHEENDSILWIGTDGGGINKFNIYQKRFTHYPESYSYKVVSIVDFSPNELLLSLFDSGLAIFNKQTHRLTPFVIVNDSISKIEINTGKSVNLLRQNNSIYIFSNHIYRYQLNTHTFELLPQNMATFRTSPMQFIEKSNEIIYLMGGFDLFSFTSKNQVLKNIYSISAEMPQLTTGCQDEEGIFWLGTSGGLYQLNANTGEQRLIPSTLFQAVTSLLSDKQGRIWIGAKNKLFCYIIKEDRFEVFSESDGVYPNELFACSTLLSHSGHLFMGGSSGLIFINKRTPMLPTIISNVKLADIFINGSSIFDHLNTQKVVTLPYDFSLLEVKVLLEDEDLFHSQLYRFRIEGLDTYYTESYSSTLSLRTLPSGSYTIKAQCLLRNGNWTPETSVLKLKVNPPWWRSILFILLTIITIIVCAFITLRTFVRKKENRLFKEKQEHEQHTYEEKVRFLINISHELRTPLTLIYGPIKRLLSLTPPPEDLHRQLTSILKQTKQMKNTIDMVLDVRKMELGFEKLQLASVDMKSIIQNIAEDFLNECNALNITQEINNDIEIGTVALDSKKFGIILSNLLSNAIKFSPLGGVITIATQKENNMVRITVTDQGPGLKDVDLTKLFVRFYQGNHGLSGSGIGLSYSKLLVEMHGGTIDASEIEPHGAKFSFTILLQSKEGESLSSQPYLNQILPNQTTSEPQIKNPLEIDTNRYCLLIVEDNVEMCEFIYNVLIEHFHHILTAQSGSKALQMIHTHKPDVIISDLSMAEMNGYELCRTIKNNVLTAHIPFILLSSQSDDESASISYQLGADAYLTKPFEANLLLTLIVKQISNREMLRQRYSGIQNIEGALNNADEMFIVKFNQTIVQNIADPNLDIQMLCKLMGMSRSALYSRIKQLTGTSTKEYLNKTRMDKAIQLLTTTTLTISEISENVGFTYSRYFSNVFRQHTGMLPSKYRQNLYIEESEKKQKE